MTKQPNQNAFLSAGPTAEAAGPVTLQDIEQRLAEAKRRVEQANVRCGEVLRKILKRGNPAGPPNGQNAGRNTRRCPGWWTRRGNARWAERTGSLANGKAGAARSDSARQSSHRGNFAGAGGVHLRQASREKLWPSKRRGCCWRRSCRLSIARAKFCERSCGNAAAAARVFQPTGMRMTCSGFLFTDDATMWAQNRAVADGILTKAEIAEAKNANA